MRRWSVHRKSMALWYVGMTSDIPFMLKMAKKIDSFQMVGTIASMDRMKRLNCVLVSQ